VARKILTMEPDRPEATAVAVVSGRIVALGSLDEVRATLGARPFELDGSFRDHVLVPGFIDPHLHPTLAATMLSTEIVSAMEWTTPRGRTRAVRGREAFLARLRELDARLRDARRPEEWLSVWGYHAPYHGALSRRDLDAVSDARPIFVWQRSVHEMFFNTRALAEQGFPQVSAPAELAMLALEMHGRDTPYRFVLVPNAMFLHGREGGAVEAERAAADLLRWSSDRIRIPRHAKYYADGAIFSQLMQMSEPYLDGHRGEWMMTPDEQWAVLSAFWAKDWDLHIHVNGDAGLDVVLDQVERLRADDLRPGRRIVLEHYGYAREDQHRRVRKLGIAVSNNAYYVHELAPLYARSGLGPERAADISPLGGLARAGVAISFHSDFPMAPAEPLTLVWAAVNRIGSDGQVWGATQRVSLDLALRAVTAEAAWSIGVEDEIGSIRPGKRADFTVLAADPYEVEPRAIRDIGIWGTVLEGRPYPIP
jgi:predicted amidohydrolase YtcJ